MNWGIGLLPGLLALGVVAAQATPPPLPEGDKLVQTHCTSCHGLDLIGQQPKGRGRAFWAASVAKMIDTHGAEIPPEEAGAIIAFLARRH